jgi:hypothetical protein
MDFSIFSKRSKILHPVKFGYLHVICIITAIKLEASIFVCRHSTGAHCNFPMEDPAGPMDGNQTICSYVCIVIFQPTRLREPNWICIYVSFIFQSITIMLVCGLALSRAQNNTMENPKLSI